jgi:hypothetical protein
VFREDNAAHPANRTTMRQHAVANDVLPVFFTVLLLFSVRFVFAGNAP